MKEKAAYAPHLLGRKGEEIAEQYLKEKGYRILERGFKTQGIEVDIIASKDQTLVIAEVKTRHDQVFTTPEKAVDHRKQKRLIEAANIYARENHIDQEIRFDILAIILNDDTLEINHIENAFSPLW